MLLRLPSARPAELDLLPGALALKGVHAGPPVGLVLRALLGTARLYALSSAVEILLLLLPPTRLCRCRAASS